LKITVVGLSCVGAEAVTNLFRFLSLPVPFVDIRVAEVLKCARNAFHHRRNQ